MSHSADVNMRFFEPSPRLRRYFNSYFLTEVSLPDGETVTDFLMPSWGMVNFARPGFREVAYPSGGITRTSGFSITGPFTRAARLTVGAGRGWGLGILPVGWVKIIKAPTSRYANLVADGFEDETFSALRPLAKNIHGDEDDIAAELGRIERYLLKLVPVVPDDEEELIVAIFDALPDPLVASVADLMDRVGISQRKLERICNKACGFPPKTLLRRQRFLRSMTFQALNPSATWTETMDGTYHDQAQFAREFRQFMGVSAREYALLARPLSQPLTMERVADFLNVDGGKGPSEGSPRSTSGS